MGVNIVSEAEVDVDHIVRNGFVIRHQGITYLLADRNAVFKAFQDTTMVSAMLVRMANVIYDSVQRDLVKCRWNLTARQYAFLLVELRA